MSQTLDNMANRIMKNMIKMIDHGDDPGNMICRIIGDMEDTFTLARKNASKSIDSEKKIERQLNQTEEDIARWTDCAARSLKENNKDMAKRALTQKKESEIMAGSLKRELRTAADESQELNLEIFRMGRELAEIKQKALDLGIFQKVA